MVTLRTSEHNSRYPEHARSIDFIARQILRSHSWPGNVRELKHCIERACIIAKNPVVKKEDLFERTEESTHANEDSPSELKAYVRSCEKRHILEVLDRHDWAIGETARSKLQALVGKDEEVRNSEQAIEERSRGPA